VIIAGALFNAIAIVPMSLLSLAFRPHGGAYLALFILIYSSYGDRNHLGVAYLRIAEKI